MAKKPAHEIRLGTVKALVWENETERGKRHNVTFEKIYREDDTWKSTHSTKE